MKPGRELDAVIAEKVMGFTLVLGPGEIGIKVNITECKRIPHYSTDIAIALIMVEHITKTTNLNAFQINRPITEGGKWTSNFFEKKEHEINVIYDLEEGESVPHAICLAALRAIERNEK